ncbi:OmpL47-type beta-barrel domain-containing protein [Paenibacillus sp. NPDC056579]|uniref:right-handed parallel beta-helix repeat-containing protein n=1 Tax=Paenibacillus sp. NPDC056579 TaxID=3345871 RepID=UPI0036C35789
MAASLKSMVLSMSQIGKIGVAMITISLAALFVISTSVFAASYYISPTGNDNNSGTEIAPFKSIMKAQSASSSGDTVYIRGGVYDDFEIANTDSNYNYVHDITKSGITYEAYPGERPVFDFKHVPTNLRVAAFRVADKVTGIKFKGFDVTGVKVGNQKQSEVFRVIGQADFENVAAHDNEANGFYFTTRGTGIVLNCDSYNNIGPTDTSAGNTDGFGAHAGPVSFINSRAWNNSDDGFDSISSSAPVIYDHSWSFNHRGNQDGKGDKNGFKVGGYTTRTEGLPSPLPVHTVKYSLAVNNGGAGFYANHQPGQAANWTNNTAYKNGRANFDMLERVSPTQVGDIPGYREVLHDNVAYVGKAIINDNNPSENVTNNSWTINGGLNITDADFVSLDTTQLSAPRKPDGSLPDVTFMRPVPASPLYTHKLGYLADKDTIAPVTTDNAPKVPTNQDTTISFNAVDNGSGVAATYYSVDGGTTQAGTSVTISTEGVHSIVYWSVDNAGNVEEATTIVFTLDKTAPVITVTGVVYGTIDNSMELSPVLSLSDYLSGVITARRQ